MFQRKRSAEDFAQEIKAHLELEADDLKQEGLSEDEARWKARREFGNVSAAQERFYLKDRWVWWDKLRARFSLWLALHTPEPGVRGDGDSYAGVRHRRKHGGIQRDERGAFAVAADRGSTAGGVSAHLQPAAGNGHDRQPGYVLLSGL